MTVDLAIKKLFFDKEKVRKLVGDKNAKAMGRVGSFIRRRARSLIRFTKNAISAPGQPPRSHTRDAVKTLRNIRYGLGPANLSVVIGPVKLPGNGDYMGPPVPELQEFGGTAVLRRPRFIKSIFRARGKKGVTSYTKIPSGTPLNYPARPFMGPALRAEVAAGTIPDAWSSSVKSA